MGKIRKRDGTGEVSLTARVLVGRSPACGLRLNDQRVSGEHASIYFDAGHWYVRDLGSRNGTRVNGSSLKSASHAVRVGDVISFGSEDESWRFQDDSQPPPDSSIAATDQSEASLDDLRLEFSVSADEEDVRVRVVGPYRAFELPQRAFTYLLLTLARARLTDQKDATPAAECGWVFVDDLVPALYPDVEALNVNIHRARKQFTRLGVRNGEQIIERRVGSRRIRLSITDVLISSAHST